MRTHTLCWNRQSHNGGWRFPWIYRHFFTFNPNVRTRIRPAIWVICALRASSAVLRKDQSDRNTIFRSRNAEQRWIWCVHIVLAFKIHILIWWLPVLPHRLHPTTRCCSLKSTLWQLVLVFLVDYVMRDEAVAFTLERTNGIEDVVAEKRNHEWINERKRRKTTGVDSTEKVPLTTNGVNFQKVNKIKLKLNLWIWRALRILWYWNQSRQSAHKIIQIYSFPKNTRCDGKWEKMLATVKPTDVRCVLSTQAHWKFEHGENRFRIFGNSNIGISRHLSGKLPNSMISSSSKVGIVILSICRQCSLCWERFYF